MNRYDDYNIKLEELENYVRTLDGKLVWDSLNNKPLVKFNRTGNIVSINLNNPDAALETLKQLNKGVYSISCSKCHHCR